MNVNGNSNDTNLIKRADWIGKNLTVKVIYSVGGVSTSILVYLKKEKEFILVDIGDGTLRSLIDFLSDDIFSKLKTIIITHGHFDHVGGLFALLGFMRMIKRKSKLEIISPPNVRELVSIIKLFKNLYDKTIPFEIVHTEITDKIVIDNVEIKAFPVKHKSSLKGQELEKTVAVGYIFTYDDEKVVYTGDTGFFEELKTFISMADFALIEATYDSKKTNYHLTKEEAEELGKLAKSFQLIHQLPDEVRK